MLQRQPDGSFKDVIWDAETKTIVTTDVSEQALNIEEDTPQKITSNPIKIDLNIFCIIKSYTLSDKQSIN